MAYFIALFHELGHMAAANLFGYKIKCISIEPFGVCLKLDDNVPECTHEFFISLAGPLVNILLVIAGVVLDYVGLSVPKVFFVANFYMLFINLLPVMPLDGGRILKAMLSQEIGDKKAQKILSYISVPVICVMAAVGVVLLFKSKVNASLLMISVFMCNNIRNCKSKTVDIVTLYSSRFVCDMAKVFYINENTTVKEAIKMLPFGELCIVAVVTDKGEVDKFITNKYILNIGESGYLNKKINDALNSYI